MNFNFSNKPEYDLNSSLSKEMINLYGVVLKLLIVERINLDSTVFGGYTHLKSNTQDIIDVPALPEESDGWDNSGFGLSDFGPLNFDNISLFIHMDYIRGVIDLNKITGNLLVFPNNKVMEITNTEFTVPGMNNLFTFNDSKTILKLSCKPYNQKLISELGSLDKLYDPTITENPQDIEEFESLEKYFDELTNREDRLKVETEINPSMNTKKPNINEPDVIIEKPLVDNSIDDVWGKF